MTGSYGIDIVLFHGHNIFYHFFSVHNTSGLAAEFVAIYTLKYDALSVQAHNAVFHLKTAKSCFLLQPLHSICAIL